MKIEKECQCCGAIYVVSFSGHEVEPDAEWDFGPPAEDQHEKELYPEFCPFCGSHEDDDPEEDE
jgi:hypothetical protein